MTRLAQLAAASTIVATIGCGAGAGPTPARGTVTTAAITEADLRHRLYLIADDSMMGRESGSLGDYKAADYVASEFRR